jgi:hypothetical protein
MKKIIYSLLFAALFSACSTDFLDRNPLDKPSNEAFWRTEKDAMAAATGCYNGWFSMDEVIYADCASDNAYNPFTWEGWAVQAAGTATPTDPGYSYMGYGNMVRYNNFLENIHRPEMNEDLRKRLIAEVRFLRAWDYFQKVTHYGDVPLVTSVLEIKNANLPRTEKAKVVEFILKELKEIAPQLPESYSGYFFLSGTGLLVRFFFNKINLIVFYFKSYLRSCQQFRQCFIQTGIFHLNRNFAIHIDQLIAEYQPHSCLCFYRRQYFFYLLIIKIQRNFL